MPSRLGFRPGYAEDVAAHLHASAVPVRVRSRRSARTVHVGHGHHGSRNSGIIIEFEPDIPLDPDGSWTARILLPSCCRRDTAHGAAVEERLDELNHDGTVLGRGALVAQVAARAARAWVDHVAHTRTDNTADPLHETMAVDI